MMRQLTAQNRYRFSASTAATLCTC